MIHDFNVWADQHPCVLMLIIGVLCIACFVMVYSWRDNCNE